MSYKDFLLAAALIALCCILSSCGNLLPVNSSSGGLSVSEDNLNIEPASLDGTDSDQGSQIIMPDGTFSLSSLILPDFLSITVNGSGVTSVLQDSEIDDFLDVVENKKFSVVTNEFDMLTPGAVACTISIEYGNGNIQRITVPYFLHDSVLYVTDASSFKLLSPFLDSKSK